jgi:hypothetical protein
MLSGVMGIPAKGDDGICLLSGGPGAAASECGFLTGPRRTARRPTTRIAGSAGWAAWTCCGGDDVCAAVAVVFTMLNAASKAENEGSKIRPRQQP